MNKSQSQLPKQNLSIGKSCDLRSTQLLSSVENSQVIGHESISIFVMERLRDNLQTSLKNQQTKIHYLQDNVSEQKPQKALRESEPMFDLELAN